MVKESKGLIFLDSSVLIEYFRKTKKENSFLYKLSARQEYNGFLASTIVQLEIFRGSNIKQQAFWENLFEDIIVLSFNDKVCFEAVDLFKKLKLKRKALSLADLIIAASALCLDLPLATVNEKDFIHVDGLTLITPSSF